MGDIDCDDFGIDSAMRRARRIRWQNSRTVPYVAHDADDCAPELEVPDGYPSAVVLHDDARTVCPWLAARCYSSGLGLAFRWFDTEDEALTCAARLQADFDTDPPSPRDDDDCAAGLVLNPSLGDSP